MGLKARPRARKTPYLLKARKALPARALPGRPLLVLLLLVLVLLLLQVQVMLLLLLLLLVQCCFCCCFLCR